LTSVPIAQFVPEFTVCCLFCPTQEAIERISNIWELGHLRCIVSDILAKFEDDATVRAHLSSYAQWDKLKKMMQDMKDAKVINPRHKRRRGTGADADGDCSLPVSPLSVLAVRFSIAPAVLHCEC
jgi:hypothetical protein